METLDIVDENGIPTGETIPRETAHREGILHRTAHVWVVRPSEKGYDILLQKRSMEKESFPGLYDTSSGTAYGTQLMKVTEVGDDPDWIAFYTVYRGYEVELVIHVAEGAEDQTLSDEIAEKAVQFLSDMDFVETEEVQGK